MMPSTLRDASPGCSPGAASLSSIWADRAILRNVSFDVARAVTETFGSRTPLLDRVLSYLYFAEVAVIEQSTADAWGSGVTIIGLKGQTESRPRLVLAGALPTLQVFPSSHASLPEHGAHPRDLSRLVDLFARVHAISVVTPDACAGSIALVAYRPDPVATGLRDYPSSRETVWLLSAPVGLQPRPVASEVLQLEVHIAGPPPRRPRARVRNVVSARAKTHRYDPDFPVQALWDLRRLVENGQAEVLDLEPCTGSDLLAPARVQAVLGVFSEPLALPEAWQVLPETRPTVRLGAWSVVIEALTRVAAALSEAIFATWKAAGLPPPEGPSRLVALRGPSDDCLACFVVEVPKQSTLEVREGLDALLARLKGPPGVHITLDIAGRALPEADRIFVMGPLEEQVWDVPEEAARTAAAAYVDVLSRLLREE